MSNGQRPQTGSGDTILTISAANRMEINANGLPELHQAQGEGALNRSGSCGRAGGLSP
jgi:hypothetical protein